MKVQENGLGEAKNARMERWISRCGKLVRETRKRTRKRLACGGVFQQPV